MKTLPIFIAAFLYGFLHPSTKFLVESRLAILPLCILNIGIRVVFDVGINFSMRSFSIRSWKLLGTLLALGLVGTLYQLCVFSSLSRGISVPLMIFLIYSHPPWTFLISRWMNKQKMPRGALLNLFFGFIGLLLIAGVHLSETSGSWKILAGPLCGSILVAFWICLSNLASRQGGKSQTISLYFNASSFIALVFLSLVKDHGSSLSLVGQYLERPKIFAFMLIYAIGLGSIPNYLFYYGSRSVPAFVSGLILLLEPIVSTIMSTFIWKTKISFNFFLGAFCILMANLLPVRDYHWKDFAIKTRNRFSPVPVMVSLALFVSVAAGVFVVLSSRTRSHRPAGEITEQPAKVEEVSLGEFGAF